ncbi:ABC transporter permease [Patescibacteria group bacterium]|nr:ABC transporter permease [Patescibacteria group bacterium]
MKRNTILLVAKREYIKTVRKPSFWIATLAFPILILIVSFVSGYSAQRVEEKIKQEAKEAKLILIVDKSRIIDMQILLPPFEQIELDKLEFGIDRVKTNEADALFVFPEDIQQSQVISIYAQDDGLINRGKYNDTARQLLKQSLLLGLEDANKINLFNQELKIQSTHFKDGQEISDRLEDFIVPAASVILYFVLAFLGSNFLLMSVSEEKENRVIEIILSIMSHREIIWGKIVGLLGVIFTQVIVLLILGGAIFWFSRDSLPFSIDWSLIPIDPVQILISCFYIICGFLTIATAMVGVGSAMPTYKEAQSFSSFFIMLSIFPIYFAALILQEPNGPIAMVTSYFPFTAPLILLIRNALGALSLWETFVSSVILLGYVAAGFYFSFKLFEFGSLEYSQKLSLKRLFQRR